MLRRHPHPGFVDQRGRLIEFWTEGVLPSDDPLEGLRQWNIYYRISNDGGRTFSAASQIIHTGTEFNARHPLPGIWTGKNCVMLGDRTCVPIGSRDGRILLPVQITPLGSDGKLYNPRGAYTYTETAMGNVGVGARRPFAFHSRHGRTDHRFSRRRPASDGAARLE
jgi:hypothetical protein